MVPESAENIGFDNENPDHLFGCYRYNGAQITLKEHTANFNDKEIPISYGFRKELREVVYPGKFPWLNESRDEFVFINDRFDLLDLIKGDDGVWTIQIWTSNYLSSKNPTDLSTVYFKKTPCDKS